MELSWRQRVQLWLRLGLRLVGCLLILWAAVRLGPVLVFLFAPFLLALLVAWALSPFVRWIHERLGLSRQLSALGLLGLVLVCLGGLAWWLLSAGVGEILSLAGNWESLVASFQALVDGLGGRFSRWMSLLPASVLLEFLFLYSPLICLFVCFFLYCFVFALSYLTTIL